MSESSTLDLYRILILGSGVKICQDFYFLGSSKLSLNSYPYMLFLH